MSSGLANLDATSPSGAAEPSKEECQRQAQRILNSDSFRTATTLQALLQFLTSKAINGETDCLKEYTIGVEALGRKPDFDPRVDPIVRVQSHRLRVKLKEYYETEGFKDSVLIQFPKGHYIPTFEVATPGTVSLPEVSNGVTPPPERLAAEAVPVEQKKRPSLGLRVLVVVALCFVTLAVGYFIGQWRAPKPSYDPEVVAFWSHLLGNDPTPVIAYPNAVFLLDDSNDLFRFRHGAIDSRGALVDPHVAKEFASNPGLVSQAGQLYYENGYTGTGELESVAMLSGLLGGMGLHPIIKSSRDVLPEDLARHNVILLGSPFQNPAVAQWLTAGDFSFSNPDEHHEQWRAQILNAHPGQGEAASYGTQRDPASKTLTGDYGVITFARSGGSGRWVAILGGLDTKGTEGTAMFLTTRSGVGHLNQALKDQKGVGKDLSPFQALVHVDIAKGYLVSGVDLVTLHSVRAPHAVAGDKPEPAH